ANLDVEMARLAGHADDASLQPAVVEEDALADSHLGHHVRLREPDVRARPRLHGDMHGRASLQFEVLIEKDAELRSRQIGENRRGAAHFLRNVAKAMNAA